MNTEILKVTDKDSMAQVADKAAEMLEAGLLVVVPTETVYGIACVARSGPISKINSLKSQRGDKPYTLHIGDKQEVRQYVQAFDARIKKLIDLAWPGPLTIVFEISPKYTDMQKKLAGEDVYGILYRSNTIGIRCVKNELTSRILSSISFPVVVPSANLSGESPALSAKQAKKTLGGRVDAIIDADRLDPCQYKEPSTVVKYSNYEVDILRSGAYSIRDISDMSTVNILFVCTGNTCRSPLAEGVCRSLIAEKINCDVDELNEKGYNILSAGLIASARSPASVGSVEVAKEIGVDISAHRSRPINCETVKKCDFVFAMTAGHLEEIKRLCPECTDKCYRLNESADVPDPVGGSLDVYVKVREMIIKAVKKRIGEILG